MINKETTNARIITVSTPSSIIARRKESGLNFSGPVSSAVKTTTLLAVALLCGVIVALTMNDYLTRTFLTFG